MSLTSARILYRRLSLKNWTKGNWFLLHDNAHSHNATIVKQFLAKKSVTVLYHPPYSPDLAPVDYFLFPKVKSNLKGRCFDTISDIQNNVTSELKSIPADEFYGGIQKHYDCANRCIRVRRDVCWRLRSNKVVFERFQFMNLVPKLCRRTV